MRPLDARRVAPPSEGFYTPRNLAPGSGETCISLPGLKQEPENAGQDAGLLRVADGSLALVANGGVRHQRGGNGVVCADVFGADKPGEDDALRLFVNRDQP